MTGKCNLFKPVDCTTGTFFTFSQYAQDLTREYTQADAYRCIPSKFAALNLNVQDYTDKQLGQIFQNYFENACTCLRGKYSKDWQPEATLPLVWETLEKYGLITINNESANPTCDNLQYIGDINIYSYVSVPTKDGVGYNEIYCYIPNSAQSTSYILHDIQYPEGTSSPWVYELGDETCISGYSADSSEMTYTGCHWLLEDDYTSGTILKYYDEGNDGRYYSPRGYVPDVLIDQETETTIRTADSFDFNAILVFYDIVSKGEEDKTLHHNIPLGIFFTGTPDNGSLTNTVTKFVNNEDIYNQGTSYGLRICSRFLCSPNLTKFEDTEVYTTDNNDDLTQVLSMMADNCTLFADLSKEINDMNDGLTTHMACFRNNKTNVPYLRQVNNAWYWFVNGKNTGVAANAVDQQDVDNILKRLDQISIYLRQTVIDIINDLQAQQALDISSIPSDVIESIVENFRDILNSEED